MLARDVRGIRGLGKVVTYAAVDELEIARVEVGFGGAVGKDEKLEVVFLDALKPFVEVSTAFGVKARHIDGIEKSFYGRTVAEL